MYKRQADKSAQTILLRLNSQQKDQLKKLGFAIEYAQAYADERSAELDQILRAAENNALLNDARALRDDVSPSYFVSSGIPGFPCYPSVEETYTIAQSLVDRFPDLAELVDIGDSWQKTQGLGGYDLFVLKISNSNVTAVSQAAKPILFVHSAAHARELATAGLTLAFAEKLLTEYGQDADVTWVVDHREVHILFHMNPDGRKLAEAGFDKRKNTNTNFCPENGVTFGVDLNRNFGGLWNAAGLPVDAFSASGIPCSQTFRGTEGSSEPETQGVDCLLYTSDAADES